MCVCIYIYIYMCVCVCVCVCVCMSVSVCEGVHTYIHAYIHAYMHACMQAGRQAGRQACRHAHMQAFIHTCIHKGSNKAHKQNRLVKDVRYKRLYNKNQHSWDIPVNACACVLSGPLDDTKAFPSCLWAKKNRLLYYAILSSLRFHPPVDLALRDTEAGDMVLSMYCLELRV